MRISLTSLPVIIILINHVNIHLPGKWKVTHTLFQYLKQNSQHLQFLI